MKVLRSRCLCALIVLVSPLRILADTVRSPYPWALASSDGRIVFKMVPAKWHIDEKNNMVIDRDSHGVAYRLDEAGNFVEQWRTEGWYAFRAFLSEDGRYLVRLGPWASDQEKHSDLAVAFYEEGKLLRQYEVRDLVKDPGKLEYSVSHYMWTPETQSRPPGLEGQIFRLVTIDKIEYLFDIATGEIEATSVDEGAKSRREIDQEKRAGEQKKGERLLKAWPQRVGFEQKFVISGAEAPSSKVGRVTGGPLFPEPEWRAQFSPKRQSPIPQSVSAVFPISENGSMTVTLSPAEVLGALDQLASHPALAKRFGDDRPRSMTLRITGDRLNWNISMLESWLRPWRTAESDMPEWRDWAEIQVLFPQKPISETFFLNVKTGQLLYKPEAQPGEKAALLDRNGEKIPRP